MLNMHNELLCCGLNICGVGEGLNGFSVSWSGTSNQGLADLVIAAHEKSLTSDECLALQAAITDEQWLAYQDARKQPVREQRAIRYKNTTDALFMDCFEKAVLKDQGDTYSCDVLKEKFDLWRSNKDKIREELPYPE
jgi:hypothetical protein